MSEPYRHHIKIMELPHEIIESEILPRLPSKSAVRFKCVCKEWKSFLSTDEFVDMNRHHQTINKLLFLHSPLGPPTFSTFDFESPNDCSPNIRPIPFVNDSNGVCFLASLDGLVCVTIVSTQELVLWNPLTSAYKKLPNNDGMYGFYNFFLDSIGLYIDSSNDYRLLHLPYNCNDAYIYSRRLDSWRKIEYLGNIHPTSMLKWSPSTLSGGSLYFVVNHNSSPNRSSNIRFDVNSEKFNEIGFPPIPSRVSYYESLVLIKGSIHLCLAYDNVVYERVGELLAEVNGGLWRMDGDVWMKVATFSPEPSDELLSISHLCERKDGELIAILVDDSFHEIGLKELATNCLPLNNSSSNSPLTMHTETLLSRSS